MIVDVIVYSSRFVKQYKKLPENITDVANKKEDLFRLNPLHPSLRLHALHGSLEGLWSISLTSGYRMIFMRKSNGDIVFISIGKHDIYKNL